MFIRITRIHTVLFDTHMCVTIYIYIYYCVYTYGLKVLCGRLRIYILMCFSCEISSLLLSFFTRTRILKPSLFDILSSVSFSLFVLSICSIVSLPRVIKPLNGFLTLYFFRLPIFSYFLGSVISFYTSATSYA